MQLVEFPHRTLLLISAVLAVIMLLAVVTIFQEADPYLIRAQSYSQSVTGR